MIIYFYEIGLWRLQINDTKQTLKFVAILIIRPLGSCTRQLSKFIYTPNLSNIQVKPSDIKDKR